VQLEEVETVLELAQTTLDNDEKRVAREKLGRLKEMESVLRSQTKQRRSTHSDAPEEPNMVTPRRFDKENATPDNPTREQKRSGPFGIGRLFARR
jgi:hypothetical protein